MKISTEKPPILARLEVAFGAGIWERGVIITYGDTVHCSTGGISLDLHEHEAVHIRQQREMGRDEWWDKYLADPKFRLEQELEAYKVQAAYIRKNVGNRKKQAEKLDWICTCLANSYGNIITYQEAKQLI